MYCAFRIDVLIPCSFFFFFFTTQLSKFEDEMYRCPNLMKIVGSSTSFATPFVGTATGQYAMTIRSIIAIASFLPGGLVADKCKWGSNVI